MQENHFISPFNPDHTQIGQPPRYVQHLSEMTRWEKFPSMIHRPSVYTHGERSGHIATQIIYFVQDNPALDDLVSLEVLLRHHDDHEIFDTDKPSNEKEDMTPEEQVEDAFQVLVSSEKVGKEYLKLDGESQRKYMELILFGQRKDSPISQIADVADKLDAVGEIFHEIRCGNLNLLPQYEFYKNIKLKKFEKYPFWNDLKKDPAIGFEPMPTIEELMKMPTLSIDDLKSRETLKQDTYDSRLPAWYRSWLGITYDLFKDEPQPEFHIFPGWRNELRLRWNKRKIELT